MTVKKLDKLSWSHSGRPVAPSERKVLLAVLRRARREGRVREAESPSELRHSMFPQEESQPFSAYTARPSEERGTMPAPLEPPRR